MQEQQNVLFFLQNVWCTVCWKEESWISVGATGGNWKNSVKRIREHAATQYHMSSMVAFKSYLQNKPIDCLLDQQRAEQSRRQKEIASNRQVLKCLLDIIRLLAKQNLALHRHSENASSLNRGNFLEFVHHQAKYDPILQQHRKHGKMPHICHHIFRTTLFVQWLTRFFENILVEVKEAKLFSILVDKTPDAAHQEQVSLFCNM